MYSKMNVWAKWHCCKLKTKKVCKIKVESCMHHLVNTSNIFILWLDISRRRTIGNGEGHMEVNYSL